MNQQQVPPSYGLFLLGKKQRKQAPDSGSELSQSATSQGERDALRDVYRDSTYPSSSNVQSKGYHAAEHNTLLNEVRSQLSDLKDLLSTSKSSDIPEISAEPSDLRITDEQLAQIAPEERGLFLRRVQDLQNELLSEDISSSISNPDRTSHVRGSQVNQMSNPQIPTARPTVSIPVAVTSGKAVAMPSASITDSSMTQGASHGVSVSLPRMSRQHTGTPAYTSGGNKGAPSSKVSAAAGSSYLFGDESRRSIIEQPRVVSIQRANLEVDNTASMPHESHDSDASEFSVSDISDIIEANVVLPPKLPPPPPQVNQRAASNKRAKTPSEPRTVIQRVKPEIDDIVLQAPELQYPPDSEPDPDEYSARLTVQRRPQSAGQGKQGLSVDNQGGHHSSANAKYIRQQQGQHYADMQASADDNAYTDPTVISANSMRMEARHSGAKRSGNSRGMSSDADALAARDQGTNGSYRQGAFDAYNDGEAMTGAVQRSFSQKGMGKTPTRQQHGGSDAFVAGARGSRGNLPVGVDDQTDDDTVSNIYMTANNFVKIPKQQKPVPIEETDSVADVMTIPENTVLYKPKQYVMGDSFEIGSASARSGKAASVHRSRSQRGSSQTAGRSHQGDDYQDDHGDVCGTANVLSIQKESAVKPGTAGQRRSSKDGSNVPKYGATSMPGMSGYCSEDISVEDDIQETKLLLSVADAGRSRLVTDKSTSEKKHKRQRLGPNHMVVTQLAQYETKPQENITCEASDEDSNSSDPEVTISKLVYPKLTASEQEKLRRLAEMRPKKPRVAIPDVRVYGRPTEGELTANTEQTSILSGQEPGNTSAMANTSMDDPNRSHLYSNVTPYLEYKKKMAQNGPQSLSRGKSMKESYSDETLAQEVTQFVNDRYVALAREANAKDPSILYNDSKVSGKNSSFSSMALHIRSDMTLGDIARSGRKFVVAKKEDVITSDMSKLTAQGGNTQPHADDSSDSEPQYEDMTILPAAEPYYGLPQPDFESFNHSIQSMRQSLLMKSSNMQSTSLTENQLDDKYFRAKEAIRTAERQNGLSPSMLNTGSTSANWNQTSSSPTMYMPHVVSPAAHPRVRPTSRSHPPVSEMPVHDSGVNYMDGAQSQQPAAARINSMDDMVMPDRTGNSATGSSGSGSSLMQQLQKYGTIDPKAGMQKQGIANVPRSGRSQTLAHPSGSASSQSGRASRSGPQSAGYSGSVAGPRPSKQRYLQAAIPDSDHVTEAVALAKYILAQNRGARDPSGLANMMAVLTEVAERNLALVSGTDVAGISSAAEFLASAEYVIPGVPDVVQARVYRHVAPNTCLEEESDDANEIAGVPNYCLPKTNRSVDGSLVSASKRHSAPEHPHFQDHTISHTVLSDFSLDLDSESPSVRSQLTKLDIVLPKVEIKSSSSSSAPCLADTLLNESPVESDTVCAVPEYTLKAQAPHHLALTPLTANKLEKDLEYVSYALGEYIFSNRPILLERELTCIQSSFEDPTISSSLSSNEVPEITTAPVFTQANKDVQQLSALANAVVQQQSGPIMLLEQNRRSSMQYYRNAQLLLYRFVPESSAGDSVMQSRNQPQPTHTDSADISSVHEQDLARRHGSHDTSTRLEHSDTKPLIASPSRTDTSVSCIAPANRPLHAQLDITASLMPDSSANVLTATVGPYIIPSNRPEISVESEEMDISMVDTLRASVEVEVRAHNLPKIAHNVPKDLSESLQLAILKEPRLESPCIAENRTNTEFVIPHTNSQVYKAATASPITPVTRAVPIYTLNSSESITTRLLYASTSGEMPYMPNLPLENITAVGRLSYIVRTASDPAGHSPPRFHPSMTSKTLVAEEELMELELERQRIDAVRSSLPMYSSVFQILLPREQDPIQVAEKEYIIEPIVREDDKDVVIALPDYIIDFSEVSRNIRLTSLNRTLTKKRTDSNTCRQAHDQIATVSTELIRREQHNFELVLPFLRRRAASGGTTETDTYLDVVAMHDVRFNPSPTRATVAQFDLSHHIAAQKRLYEDNRTTYTVSNLSRSQSLCIKLDKPTHRTLEGNKYVKRSLSVHNANVRHHSIQRDYVLSTEPHKITVTKFGNQELIGTGLSIGASHHLHTQRSYIVKAQCRDDDNLVELTIHKKAFPSSQSVVKQGDTSKEMYTQRELSLPPLKKGDVYADTPGLVPQSSHAQAQYTLRQQPPNIEDTDAKSQLIPVSGQQPHQLLCTSSIQLPSTANTVYNKLLVPTQPGSDTVAGKEQRQSDQSLFLAPEPLKARTDIVLQPNSSTKLKDYMTIDLQAHSDTSITQEGAPILSQPTITTAGSTLGSYVSLPSIEGPSLPLKLEFSRPDHITSIMTLDDTLDSIPPRPGHSSPQYTNFDTPSAIPPSTLRAETTFQTPDIMGDHVSTNILLYPQTELLLRGSAPAKASAQLNVLSPSICITDLKEREAPQLYTQASYHIKPVTTLDSSVVVQECKKTDFVRSFVKSRPKDYAETSDDDVTHLAVTPWRKEHQVNVNSKKKEGTARIKAADRIIDSDERLSDYAGSSSVTGPLSTSVSELLGQINVVLNKTELPHIRPRPTGQSEETEKEISMGPTSTSTEIVLEASAMSEYQTLSEPTVLQSMKLLPRPAVHGSKGSPVLPVTADSSPQITHISPPLSIIPERVVESQVSVVQPMEGISRTDLTDTMKTTQQVQLQATIYKAPLVSRGIETAGPYRLKKETSNKDVLVREEIYTIKCPSSRSSYEHTINQRVTTQESQAVQCSLEAHGSVQAKDGHFDNRDDLIDEVVQLPSKRKQYRSADTLVCDAQQATITSMRGDASKRMLENALVILERLSNITEAVTVADQHHTASHNNELAMRYHEEFLQALDSLSHSIHLSAATIKALNDAYLSLNGSLLDKTLAVIRDNIQTNIISSPAEWPPVARNISNESKSVETVNSVHPVKTAYTQSEFSPAYPMITQTDGSVLKKPPLRQKNSASPKPVKSKSRLEELLRFDRELARSKDTLEKYTNLLDSPIGHDKPLLRRGVEPVSNRPKEILQPGVPVTSMVSTESSAYHVIDSPDQKAVSTVSSSKPSERQQQPEPLQNVPMTQNAPYIPCSSESDALFGEIAQYSYDNHDQIPPLITHIQLPVRRPLKPKKEICLPVIQKSLVARIEAEAQRRVVFTEAGLVNSKIIGPHLRMVRYTQESIVNHLTFSIFDDIMNTVTIECVESMKGLMGLT